MQLTPYIENSMLPPVNAGVGKITGVYFVNHTDQFSNSVKCRVWEFNLVVTYLITTGLLRVNFFVKIG